MENRSLHQDGVQRDDSGDLHYPRQPPDDTERGRLARDPGVGGERGLCGDGPDVGPQAEHSLGARAHRAGGRTRVLDGVRRRLRRADARVAGGPGRAGTGDVAVDLRHGGAQRGRGVHAGRVRAGPDG